MRDGDDLSAARPFVWIVVSVIMIVGAARMLWLAGG
jgi:hypothetical protein